MSDTVGGYRVYSTKAGAERAVRKNGLHGLPLEIRKGRDGRFLPVLFAELEQDRQYVRDKGFMALPPKASRD